MAAARGTAAPQGSQQCCTPSAGGRPGRASDKVRRQMPGRAAWRFSIAALLLAVTVAACTPPADQVAVGERAPSFAAQQLDGTAVSLQQLRGEVVLLNVWATWCFPCRREMPALEELHREWERHGLRVVAVSVDAAGAARDVQEFVDELGLTFDILHDPEQRVARAFRTIGVPETFLIDADGRLRRHWIGRVDPRSDSFRQPVAEALREMPDRVAASSGRD